MKTAHPPAAGGAGRPLGDAGSLSGSPEPPSAGSCSLAGLAPDLQHVLFWMANAVELLYFVQQRSPLFMQSLEELGVTGEPRAGPARHCRPASAQRRARCRETDERDGDADGNAGN